MSEMHKNPFLEGSVEVPDEEVAATTQALLEEAARVRARASEIKEKAAKARMTKEAARKLEIAKMEAELEAARAQVIKTVAKIPKATGKPTFRPAPPPTSETLVLSSGKAVDPNKIPLLDEPVSTVEFISDIVSAAVAVTFTFLIFKGI